MCHRTLTRRLWLFALVLAGGSCQGNHAPEAEASRSILYPEGLLSYGFKRSPTDPDYFTLEHARLADVARNMGFSPEYVQLMQREAGPTDSRAVMARGIYIVFTSETHDQNGNAVADSLNDPQAICTVSVSFAEKQSRNYLKIDARPSLRVTSVRQSQTTPSQLEITIELAATGSTPLTASKMQFRFRLSGAGSLFSNPVFFNRDIPEPVIVMPGQPLTVTVGASTDDYVNDVLHPLHSGSYALTVSIGGEKDQKFDYQMWDLPIHSDVYDIVIR